MTLARRYLLNFVLLATILIPTRVVSQALRTNDLVQVIRDNSSQDYCSFVLEKLKSHQIVMLADQGHGISLYYQTVIQILNHWITSCEREGQSDLQTGLPHQLYLVLETDSVHIAAIKRYLSSGNLIDVVDPEFFMGYQFTTASLRFYADLRDVHLRIDSLNHGRSKASLLQFDLFGPEKSIDLTDWSVEKRERFFVYERDEYSSSKIIQLLDAQPTAKILIFYGGAHLLLGEQPKPPGKPTGKGYYLAHYLAERFHDQGGIYRCDQVSIPVSRWLDPAFEKIGHSFAADNSSWSNVSIALNSSFPQFDGAIYHTVRPEQSKHLSKILSEALVDLILKKIEVYRSASNEFSRGFLKQWLVYLGHFTDKEYASVNPNDSLAVAQAINELKQWRQSTNLDVVQQIDKLVIWRRFIDRIAPSQDPQSTQYQMLLGSFVGFKVWFHQGASPQVRANAIWKAVNRYRAQITTDNLIGLLWLGTATEKEQALSILKRDTGQHFTKPNEWEDWLAQSEF